MRLFRDLFPFSQPMAGKKAAEVRQLLDTVSGLSSYEVAAELASQIIPAIADQKNLHLRFKFLEDARQEAEKALPVLERHIDSSVLPLPLAATTSALTADNLLKGLAAAYFDIAKEVTEGSHQKGLTHLLQRAIHRAMLLISRRQTLAYRSYTRPSSNSWLTLHELYQMARSLRTRVPDAEISPIEHQYLSALLFAYLEPSKLPRSELTAAIFCTQQLSAHAAITEITPETNTRKAAAPYFLVRPEEGNPGTPLLRMAQGTPVFDGFIVDCSGVLDALNKSAERASEHPGEPGLDISPTLRQTLQLAIGNQAMRRFARKRFKPHADLVGGLAQVIPFIEGDAHSRRAIDMAGHNHRRAFSPSEWSLIDQSPDGFLVRFIQGDKWQAGVGNIVALQPRESSKIHVCMVRRISNSNQGRLELGLQVLSPQVSVIPLPGHGELRRGIYLHSLPAFGNHPGIIARTGHLASGHKIKLDTQDSRQLLQIGRRLEAAEGIEFFALVPL